MDEQQHHHDLIKGISEQYQDILSSSKQGIYIYLDDIHKVCNAKFASMLGYSSPEEWAKVEDSFPKFVEQGSQSTLVHHYQDAMEKRTGSTFNLTWSKKGGGTLDTTVILVPVAFENHLFALHFIQ